MRQATLVSIPSHRSESRHKVAEDDIDFSHPAEMGDLDVYPMLTPNG